MFRVVAPGKIILFGEHSVVYDKLGIAGALGINIEMSAYNNSDGFSMIRHDNHEWDVKSTKDEITEKHKKFMEIYKEKNIAEICKFNFRDAILIVAGEVFDRYGYKDCTVEVHKGPQLKGVGGSASIFSGMAISIAKLLGKELTKKEINEIAYLGEVIAHAGMPSGIDNNTVVHGGYISYRKSVGVKPLQIDFRPHVVLVDSGVPANTKKTVSYVREQREADPDAVNEILDNLDRIADWALECIQKKNTEKLGSLMYDFYDELRKLKISVDELDKIIEIAKENDFLGAKPTGGWGGGICIILARDEDEVAKIRKVYEDSGFKTFVADLGVPGARIV